MPWVTISGQHVFVQEGEPLVFHPSDKMKRAIESQVRCGKSEQDIAERSEAVLSRQIGVPRTRDNSAFDLQNDDAGIECKTLLTNKNGKITMSKKALGRKLSESQAEGLKTHTVVIDRRAGWASGNPMAHATYYYKAGLGSFQVSGMKKVSLTELKEALRP